MCFGDKVGEIAAPSDFYRMREGRLISRRYAKTITPKSKRTWTRKWRRSTICVEMRAWGLSVKPGMETSITYVHTHCTAAYCSVLIHTSSATDNDMNRLWHVKDIPGER